jgi:hypothetical protein
MTVMALDEDELRVELAQEAELVITMLKGPVTLAVVKVTEPLHTP